MAIQARRKVLFMPKHYAERRPIYFQRTPLAPNKRTEEVGMGGVGGISAKGAGVAVGVPGPLEVHDNQKMGEI